MAGGFIIRQRFISLKGTYNVTRKMEFFSSSLPITENLQAVKVKSVVGAKKFFKKEYYDTNENADMDIDCTDHENPKQHLKVPNRH